MYSVKINSHFVEISKYNKKNSGLEKNEFRQRNYMYESAMRAKGKVIDYVLNNDWTHFITITIDGKKMDRTDYKTILKKLTEYFKNWRKLNEPEFRYILVPELHKRKEKNGKRALHFHGFIYTQKMDLTYIETRDNAQIYVCSEISKRFGRKNEFTVIYNKQEFIAYYISKYISKGYDKILNRRFFKSEKLKTSDVLRYDDLEGFKDFGLKSDYKNTFCEKWKFTHVQWDFIKEYIEFVNLENEYEKFKQSNSDVVAEIDSLINESLCNWLDTEIFGGGG